MNKSIHINLQGEQQKPRNMPPRQILYPKDIENITGRAGRTARKLVSRIRQALGKSNDQFISVKEFCDFTGIDEELVREFL